MTAAAGTEGGRLLLAFGIEGLIFAVLALGIARLAGKFWTVPSGLGPICAAAGVAALGYAVFWLTFASSRLGRAVSWSLLAAAVILLLFRPKEAASAERGRGREWLAPLLLAFAVGAGGIGLTCLFRTPSFAFAAANRFIDLPYDNQIPAMVAEKLWRGLPPKSLDAAWAAGGGAWRSSDRPPLQAGWILLARPLPAALGFDPDASSMAASVWFQLLWVPALWALLRRLGTSTRRTAAAIAAVSFTGVLMLFTVFTWPKLGAAALALAAFLLWWTEGPAPAGRTGRFALGGLCAGLGWLAHGSVAFSLIGLAPLAAVAIAGKRQTLRAWLAAGAVFLLLWAPWAAYQKFYDPPGNRLLKWHLAGVLDPDPRSFPRTLADSYRALGWRGALSHRLSNLRLQGAGDWSYLVTFRFPSAASRRESRIEQVRYTAFSFGWWLPAAAALPWAACRRRRRTGDGLAAWAAAWWIAGWLVWLALMFQPGQAIVHQGTPVTPLLGLALLAWSALALPRACFFVLWGAEASLFLASWIPAAPAAAGPVDPVAAAAAIAAGGLLAAIAAVGAAKA